MTAMPFDSTGQTTRADLEARIAALAADPATQRMLRTFSPWTIRANRGRNPKSPYMLDYGAPEDGRPDGHYFLTNLVLQGGGTLGLAHAGFIRGLEIAGFRFPGIAGTSAGAILVMGGFAARGDNILNEMSDTVHQIINDAPMADFVDAPRQIRRLLKRYASGRSIMHPVFWLGAWQAVRRMLTRRGLNPGHFFEEWTGDRLRDMGIRTVDDLRQLADTVAADLCAAGTRGRKNPFTKAANREGIRGTDIFKMISVAMPTGMKFTLPEDLPLLDTEYGDVTPARLLRMSMSIPAFFEPVRMATHPRRWRAHVKRSRSPFVSDKVAADLADLTELYFLDGGIFSNLPTESLVEKMSDAVGTISVPLVQTDQRIKFRRPNRIKSLISDAGAVINAVRLQADREAHARSQRDGFTNRLALKIDTGDINWLDFAMPDTTRAELYELGLKRALTALEKEEFVNG